MTLILIEEHLLSKKRVCGIVFLAILVSTFIGQVCTQKIAEIRGYLLSDGSPIES
jgi:hypothetical protein